MAENRSFFKRSFEILGGTAIEIGKDYTSNFQSLVSDAGNIKNTVIQGAVDAKTQFQNMRKGNGPIKGLIDWFFNKETEMDVYSLDDDSDFDAGTSFGQPEEEDKGPAMLDNKGAERVAKGHAASMFKIASKIAETQVANTAEIITTINSRTSELLAATNNINTTLIGISKKLDVVTSFMNARSPQTSRGNSQYDSILDANGRYTLGSVWNAAKNNVSNGSLDTAKTLLSMIKSTGGLRPEDVLRFAWDFTLGEKDFKFLGNQSFNEFGKKFNDAIGQSISDALSKVTDMSWFKHIFGDIKEETRSTNFRSYTRNEYTRDPAVFDGMTRLSIVKTIPEYLKKIYESLSGKTLNVGNRGQLTEKEGMTFKSVTTDAIFGRSAVDTEMLSGFLSSEYGKGSGLNRYDANTIGKALTGSYISWMMYYGKRVIDRDDVNPNDSSIVGTIAYFYAMEHNMMTTGADGKPKPSGQAYATVRSLLEYISSDRGRMNRFIGELNNLYDQAFNRIEKNMPEIMDPENASYMTEQHFQRMLGTFMHQRKPTPKPQVPSNLPDDDVAKFLGQAGSGNPLKIYAGAADAIQIRTTSDTLNDIRELLSVTTKHMIGAKKFRSITPKLSKPSAAAATVTVAEYDPNDEIFKQRQTPQRVTVSGAFGEMRQGAKEIASNAANTIGDVLPEGWDPAVGFMKNRVEDLKNLSKPQLDMMGAKIKDAGYNLSVKTGLAGLGNSKEDEEDRNTVSMISAFMQTAINSGSASPEEKNSIQRLIETIHNQQLRQKLMKSVNAQLDRASIKSETGEDGKGKKTIFGKLLSVFGLILSPVKLMAKTITFILPKIFTGLRKYVKLFNFGGDLRNIRQGFSGVWSGIKEYRQAKREQRDMRRREQDIDMQAAMNYRGSSTGEDGSESSDFGMVQTPAGMGQYGADNSSYYLNDSGTVKTASNVRTARIVGSADDRRIREMMRADERAERESKRELREAKRALKEAEKAEKRLAKEEEKARKAAEKDQGFWSGFKSGFGGAFKGIGTLDDFKKSFKEAAGISTGKKVTVEGVDGEAESFTDRILAKFAKIFSGEEESVFKKIEENTDETDNNPVGGGKDTAPGVGEAGGVVGAINDVTQSTGTGGLVSTNITSTAGEGASSALMNLAEGGAASATTGAAGAAGAASGALAGAAGTAGKMVSMVAKIGSTVGKIFGSLGTIGLAIGKIVIKATLMLSGFKALMKTIGSITTQATKIVKILLEPLNKIFHFVNKILRPIISTLATFLKKIASMVSSVVGAIVDTIVPILNGIITPIMNAISPVLDIITQTLGPIFELLSGVIEVVFIPIGGIFKYVLTPIIKTIGNTVKIIAGVLEVGIGAIMKGLGNILSGIGLIGKLFGASGLYDAGKQMAATGDQMLDQGISDVKNGFISLVSTAVKALLMVDQSEDYDNTHIRNPNAPEVNSVGSVMDGYAGGDYNRIYGSGNKSQRAYGSTLDISNNGCGPLALADAASRRSGKSVDGLSMASSMAKYGSYEPGKGTSVGSFMSAANSMGMGLRPAGVTQSSLKYASPSNPITVVGSGADFGTRKGNNHYMNVVGTDKYGGAYVSNPLTGRVDRKSASSIAGSSLLGLYGMGDASSYYQFPDTVADAIAELKNLTSAILGMFTQSTTDAMHDQMSQYDAQGQLDSIKQSINDAQGDKYDGKSYEEIETAARDAAFADFETKNPRQAGETEDAYNARFEKWYTPSVQLKYMSEQGAYEAAKGALEHRSGSVTGALDSMTEGFAQTEQLADSAYENAREYNSGSSDGSGGSFTADNGVALWTDKYKDNIEITDTNISSEHDNHSPLFEFFAKTMGIPLSSIGGYGWFENYNHPNKYGVGRDGGSHEGIDFSGDVDGRPLYATTGGTVVSTTPASAGDGGGNIIVWKDAGGMNHWYMHMRNEPRKKKGDTVRPGDLLGYVGTTGRSSGPHLHYTINKSDYASASQAINPLMYFKNFKSNSGGLVGDDNYEKIWSYLTGVGGLTPYAAAGLMGAWQVESGNDPNTLEGYYYFPGGKSGDTVTNALKNYDSLDDFVQNKLFPAYRNDSSMNGKWNPNGYLDQSDGHYYPGLGLAQWTGGRTKNLLKYASSKNRTFNDLEMQLDFWKSEKEGAYSNTFSSANNAVGTDEATSIILSGYEGVPGNKLSQRQQYAREFFEKYKEFKPTATAATDAAFSSNNYTGIVTVDEGSYLNLRRNPSTDSDVLAQIPNGTKLSLTFDGNEGWYKTTYDGQTGYVSADYLSVSDAALRNVSGPLPYDGSNNGSSINTSTQYPQTYDQAMGVKTSPTGTSSTSKTSGTSSTSKTYGPGNYYDTSTTTSPINAFGFDIWSSDQYRKQGNTGEGNARKKRAFEYLANLSSMAFDYNSKHFNSSFRDNWYIPGEPDTEQLSYWGAWSKDFAKWDNNPNKYSQGFPIELKALKEIYGAGDSNLQLPDTFTTSMNDISGFAKTLSQLGSTDADGNVTINRVTVASNDPTIDKNIQAILNNTFNVREERVEQLLEEILKRMNNQPSGTGGRGTTQTPNLFNDDNIPVAVERLSRG